MDLSNKNILIVFFSHSGNTQEIATQIYDETGGDVLELYPVNPYPRQHNAVAEQAKHESITDFKPDIEGYMYDVESYDIIFVGSPVWWYTIAPPVKTFLSENDFDGKIIVPFCTHEGSGQAMSFTYIKTLLSDSIVLDGFECFGSSVKNAQFKVSDWINKLEITD